MGVKKSMIEKNIATEEERIQYNVQNWSMDDFLPERKIKKGKSRRSLKSDNASRGSRGSKSSKGSRRSTVSGSRKSKGVYATLPKAIFALPKEDYSIWNAKNRKRRKKIVR